MSPPRTTITSFLILSQFIYSYHCTRSDINWGYDANETNWVVEYPDCGGDHQSPIDIVIDEQSSCSEPIELEWHASLRHFAIRNNGHSLQAMAFDLEEDKAGELAALSVLNHRNDTDIRLNNAWYNTYTSPINESM